MDDAYPIADVQIIEFRQAHNDALLDPDHAEHSLRVQELTALYQTKHGEQPEAVAPAPTLLN